MKLSFSYFKLNTNTQTLNFKFRMWSTQRNLSGLINSVLVSRKYELFPVLEEELNKNVDTFVNILKNSVRVELNKKRD